MIRHLKDNPTAFNSATITILVDALDEAWRQVEADRITYKIDGHVEGARNALAKAIMDMAKQGEREPLRLIQSALGRLRL